MTITHLFSSAKSDQADATLVRPSNWNAAHNVDLADYTGWITSAGNKRTTAQFDKTANTSLANITGLSVTLVVGRTYVFEIMLFTNSDSTGGQKYALSGSCVPSTLIAYSIVAADRVTALDAVFGEGAGSTTVQVVLKGLITVGTGGTLTAQFAQSVASGTSSILVGSYMSVQDVT